MARWLAAEPARSCSSTTRRAASTSAPSATSTALLTGLAAEGVAVVMLSTEVDEHVELMDRVLVFREGSVFAQFDGHELSREGLVASFFGRERDRHG